MGSTHTLLQVMDFDFRSLLLSESEARLISNRPDLNTHLTKLRKEGVISEYVESGKRNFANEFASLMDFSKYAKGATYVSLESSMILQDEVSDRKIDAELDHRESQPVRFLFNRYWPLCLYPCQTTTLHGVIFSKVPNFQSTKSDTKMVWTFTALLCRVEVIWRLTCETSLYTSRWQGWMLVNLTKYCFNLEKQRRQASIDPFKSQYISAVDRLLEKIGIENYPDLI